MDNKNHKLKIAERINNNCKVCDKKYKLGCLEGCERKLHNFKIDKDNNLKILLHSVT